MTPFKFASMVTMVGVATLTATAQQSAAPNGTFTVVNDPSGGRYIYGPLPGHGSMPEAILYMLRQIHGYFGTRPEVGKFFESRDGGSMSTFM